MKGLLSASFFAALALAQDASEPETYDYIVVGSGPGGGPLACNLARAGYSTLLLEAGDDHSSEDVYKMLPNFNAAGNDERTRWDFFVKHSDDPERALKYERLTWRTAEGEFYVGLDPPEGAEQLGVYYPRAGALGGCAMHNAGVCSLPSEGEWAHIANVTGDDSWLGENMRQYLIQTEKNLYMPEGAEGHGFDGWMSISTGDASWAGLDMWPANDILRSMAELTGQDPDEAAELVKKDILVAGEDTESSFYNMAQHGDDRGQRSSPNNYIRATLADEANYPLTVQLNSFVTKVLFDEEGDVPAAVGVEVLQGASLYRADPRHSADAESTKVEYRARREVIVSGGAFNSPQLLKLSGIGPREELESFDIPVLVDSPGVGENLGDNYEGDLLALGQSPTGGSFITMIFRTESAPTEERNIFTWCGAFSFEGFWPGFPEDYGANQYECAMVHMHPKSQAGSVKLVSADPLDMPEINFRFFEVDGDQDLLELVEAANLLRESWQSAGDEVLPYDEKHPCPGTGAGDCTVEEQMQAFKEQVYSHHATSTCKIGADDDEMAVLDSKFRVRGVSNLRVVDASVWPKVPGAFPVLPTAMLSAKASDDIIADAMKADEESGQPVDEEEEEAEEPVDEEEDDLEDEEPVDEEEGDLDDEEAICEE